MGDRWIELEGLANMRDVGGLPTREGGRTVSHRLIRSDNLQDLSDADVARLVREVGVTDVVDLRTPDEVEREGPGPLRRVRSLTHHHHSLLAERPRESRERTARRALVLAERDEPPRRDGAFWAGHYLGYLEQRPDSVSSALEVVATARGAAVVHCAAGKDRTGIVVALALDVAEVPREEIVADYVLSATRIEAILGRLRPRPGYGEALSKQPTDDQTPRAEAAEAFLAVLDERWGGSTGWLLGHGWTPADVEHLRARLTIP